MLNDLKDELISRALTIINISLSNQPDLIQHDEGLNQNRLNDLKQKIEFLLNKIDVISNTNELQLILEQEQEQEEQTKSIFESVSLTNSLIDNNLLILIFYSSSSPLESIKSINIFIKIDINSFI